MSEKGPHLKLKTRKIVMKRFKVTATGKILHRTQGMRHLRANKSAKQIRRYRVYHEITGKIAKAIRRMLAI